MELHPVDTFENLLLFGLVAAILAFIVSVSYLSYNLGYNHCKVALYTELSNQVESIYLDGYKAGSKKEYNNCEVKLRVACDALEDEHR